MPAQCEQIQPYPALLKSIPSTSSTRPQTPAMSSISPRTLDDLTVAVSSLSKALQHPVHYTGDSSSISRAVKYCYEMAKHQLAQPITDEQIQNISNEYVWCYIIEMGPIHLAWFGPSTSINQACARLHTLKTFMQDRLRGDALSSPDAHNLVQCVDAILEAYDDKPQYV